MADSYLVTRDEYDRVLCQHGASDDVSGMRRRLCQGVSLAGAVRLTGAPIVTGAGCGNNPCRQ